MGNSLLAVRGINHKYIVVERRGITQSKPKRFDGTENLAESLGTPFSIDEEQAPVEVIASYGKYAVVVDHAVSKGRITILSDINLWQSSWNESSKDLLMRFLTNKAKKAEFKGTLRVMSLSSS